MRLESIDRVTTLQNDRSRAMELRDASGGGQIEVHSWYQGVRIDACSVISAEAIRATVFNECTTSIIKIEAELKTLGVYIKNPEAPFGGTLEGWRDTAHMYCSAWKRELGGHIANKRHLIDALVVGTQNLVAHPQKDPES